MIKFLLLCASAALLFMATSYLRQVDREFTAQLGVELESQDMQHAYIDFSLINTNSQGATKYIVRSPSTVVSIDDKKTYMDFPHMVLYRAEREPVTITANQAIIDHVLNVTTLNKEVDVMIPTHANDTTLLKTEKLFFDNTNQLAYTDEYAKIIQGRSSMEGEGFEYGLQQQEIKFLNKVRGIYEK